MKRYTQGVEGQTSLRNAASSTACGWNFQMLRCAATPLLNLAARARATEGSQSQSERATPPASARHGGQPISVRTVHTTRERAPRRTANLSQNGPHLVHRVARRRARRGSQGVPTHHVGAPYPARDAARSHLLAHDGARSGHQRRAARATPRLARRSRPLLRPGHHQRVGHLVLDEHHVPTRVRCVSIFLDKNRRYIGKSQ
jgi:hypothetical protein